MRARQTARRRFLKEGATLSGFAVAARSVSGQTLGGEAPRHHQAPQSFTPGMRQLGPTVRGFHVSAEGQWRAP